VKKRKKKMRKYQLFLQEQIFLATGIFTGNSDNRLGIIPMPILEGF
jgi:hypothetical protein